MYHVHFVSTFAQSRKPEFVADIEAYYELRVIIVCTSVHLSVCALYNKKTQRAHRFLSGARVPSSWDGNKDDMMGRNVGIFAICWISV